MTQLKIYIIGALAFMVGLLSFLFQNSILKAKRKELQVAKTTAQINQDVAKILANKNIMEVVSRVDKEIKKGNVSSLDR